MDRGKHTFPWAYTGDSMTFESEESLVLSFLDLVSQNATPWGEGWKTTQEFDYSRGRTDVLGLSGSGELFAFEAKLEKWRVALSQAYRNTCFANRSFVLLPRPVAERASSSPGEFRRRGVGICFLDRTKVVVLLDARRTEPIQPWLFDKAAKTIEESKNPNA